MIFNLKGQPVESNLVSYNDGLNYGRFQESLKNVHPFIIELKLSEFIKLLEPEYNSIMEDIRADDLQYNEDSDFKAVNYCSLRELINNSYYLNEIFKYFLDRFLFSKLFKTTSFKYVINATDSINVENETVHVYGRAFKTISS